GGSEDSLVGSGGDMAEPQRLQTVFFEGLEEIFAIRRDGSLRNVAIIRNILNGEFFERRVGCLQGLLIPLPPFNDGEEAVTRHSHDNQQTGNHTAQANLFLAGWFRRRRSARRMPRFTRCRRRGGSAPPHR